MQSVWLLKQTERGPLSPSLFVARVASFLLPWLSTWRIVWEPLPHTSTLSSDVTCTQAGLSNSSSTKMERTDPSLARVRSLFWEWFVTYNLSPVGLTAQLHTSKQNT
ncbi:hypothetical protein DPMN_063023 [Dreissena polymorpha]|uniref:Uncharacterized protein n=1 Tax=Dreissena polymorpha TaxID=45954 RepID=A0A9D4CA79_DREPO|nr:hypothetical protein DPMN_063023 [Dreissena polymorpha]